jgi:alkanesulfonate monooxygenase SsuD/methylene tetrahydromethanopterin reductase-like flavin-dependent oxidoreductase (luciferase family)
MQAGYMMFLSNLHENVSDDDMIRNDLRLALRAEELGYDVVFCPEHHFEDYSMSVDNFDILTYVASKTDKIKIGLAACILPWHTQPIRIATRITLMDAMFPGRFLVGFGRGLARKEFETFGIPMAESRDRFDESAKMIIEALETGVMEGDGPHFKTPRTELRPRPSQGLKDRLYSVAMSPDSAKQIALHDTRMMSFIQFAIEKHLPNIEIYREEYRKNHNKEPYAPLMVDFCYCDESSDKAAEMATRYLSANYVSLLQHYEFMEDYHKNTAGYGSYKDSAAFLNSIGKEAAVADYVKHQAWGTPKELLDKLWARREIIGDYEWNSICSYGGMAFTDAEKSMELIGKKVLPEIKTW